MIRSADDRGRDALAAHVQECEHCRAAEADVMRVAAILFASPAQPDASALSLRALQRLRPELMRRARQAYRRQVTVTVLLALLPLPAILAYDAYLLRAAYLLISAIVPDALAAYVVLSYGAFVALLFAATYAAIPVLLARGASAQAPALS